MKHLKDFKIFESKESEHPIFPETEEEIHRLCKKYEITSYTINDDLSVDVEDDVFIGYQSLEYLPLNFNKVGGVFYCSNNNLKSLKGCPNEIGGYFSCTGNNIRSLNYFSENIEYEIYISNNPIYSLIENFIYKDNRIYLAKEFEAYGIVSNDETTVYWYRYSEFCDDYDIEMVNIDKVRKNYTVIE